MTCVLCEGTGTVQEWKNGTFAHIDCASQVEYDEHESLRDLWDAERFYFADSDPMGL